MVWAWAISARRWCWRRVRSDAAKAGWRMMSASSASEGARLGVSAARVIDEASIDSPVAMVAPRRSSSDRTAVASRGVAPAVPWVSMASIRPWRPGASCASEATPALKSSWTRTRGMAVRRASVTGMPLVRVACSRVGQVRSAGGVTGGWGMGAPSFTGGTGRWGSFGGAGRLSPQPPMVAPSSVRGPGVTAIITAGRESQRRAASRTWVGVRAAISASSLR